MPDPREGKPRTHLRCRFGFHDWLKRQEPSGEKYVVCKRCDKSDLIGPGAGTKFTWGGPPGG